MHLLIHELCSLHFMFWFFLIYYNFFDSYLSCIQYMFAVAITKQAATGTEQFSFSQCIFLEIFFRKKKIAKDYCFKLKGLWQ